MTKIKTFSRATFFLKFGFYPIIFCYCSLQTLQNYWMILSQFLSFYFCNRALGWLALSPVSPHVDVVSAHKFCSGYAVTYKFEYLFLFPEMNLDTPMKTSQRKKTSVRRLSFQEIFVSKKSSLPSSSCFHHRSGS